MINKFHLEIKDYMVINKNNHARKHGRVVDKIREKLKYSYSLFYNQTSDRYAKVTVMGKNLWGVQILRMICKTIYVEITVFISNEKTEEAFHRYMNNRGYEFIR